MKIEQKSIVGIVETVLPEFGAYLVDVRIRGERGETLVQVLVDTDDGITISACASISRKVAALIEEQGLIDSRYRLEVSSPGLDRPLKELRQYLTNSGRKVRMQTSSSDGDRTMDGILRGVDGSNVLFEIGDGSILQIAFTDIRECRHRLPW